MVNILHIRVGEGKDDPVASENALDVPSAVRLRANTDSTFSVLSKPENPTAADEYVASLRERVALVCDAPIS